MSNVRIALLPSKSSAFFSLGMEPPISHLDLLDDVLDDAQDVPWVCALLDTLTPTTEI